VANPGLDRFWGESGSAAPLRILVRERGRHEPVEFLLERPFAIIGRTAPADLVLDHPQVSRRHAFIQLIGGRAYCLDLGSRSALGWGGGIRRSGWIEPGRPVEIGPFRIDLGLATGTEFPRARPSPESSGDPLAELLAPDSSPGRIALESFGEASRSLHRVPIDQTLTTVGRAPECRLRLSDLSVSRLHCVLVRLGDTLWVVDLLGRGGVLVNGNRRRWAPLADGAQLKLGRYLYTVRIESPPTLRLRGPSGPSRALPDPSSPPRVALPPPPRRPAAGPPASIGHAPALLRAHPPEPVIVEYAQPLDDPARIAEAMIAPLVDQFALMQQQLFDQYHHSMMEMMSVFARLHEEQEGFVERELKRIKRLTREVRSLRKELDDHRKRQAAPPPPPAPEPGRAALPEPAPLPTTPQGSPEEYRAAQARIIARMTELQQERQGRWQRLLGRISGGSPDEGR
jgi:pSer/pThr/pTyr-binding forkhead associated (FHA) protein